MAKTKRADGYLDMVAWQTELAGEQLQVRVHWAMVNGQPRCVGLDLRSFRSKAEAQVTLADDARPVGGTWSEISPPLVRALRVGEVLDEARRDADYLAAAIAALPAPLRPRGRPVDKPLGKRGRPSRWTDEVLREVVAPAYLTAGSKPSKAVQEALLAKWGGVVSPDVARKGVGEARRRGYLPPHQKDAR